MLPVVALVGRPNVGKSTLFNRLTNTRDALVADFPGLTRDRKYGPAKFENRGFIVVDTGGITGDEEGIDAAMAEQSLLAIDEADVVLFLVDARAGLTPDDIGIAEHLRKQDKAMYLVANKVDGIDGDSETADFFKLGFAEVLQIAAAHGRGVSQMMTHVLTPLEKTFPDMQIVEEERDEEEDADAKLARLQASPIKLAIVGKPNVGKSTLINRILGEERVVVYDQPGTTRDSIFIPMQRDDREYILIDTAGVRKRKKVSETVEKFSIVKTLQAIEESNVVLLVIDAREGVTDQDLSLLGFVLNSGRSLVLAVNKWDGLETHIKESIKRELDRRLGFVDFARLHFISALHGTGVGHLFESVQEAYKSATVRITTSVLTQIMEMAQNDHNPPLIHGRRVKMKYAHAGGYNPPVIVIHGNQLKDLPDSYKRYLMNYYRKALKTMGTPIRVEFKEGANPFEGKVNKLTVGQERKRKRLMTFHKKK
ncbi:ribosome biogenesis GTPase Der [Brumicola nitratireducens]|uniref:GTPase Der n=1 Tax=Glaciecola nitratireducens (strain JCM 12485 / KCTC 12276 / FR1064) TaxID=1085623 RepID=G4QK43_GLANF|nr:ribosome biogenesis GTPase Der [Glaciecola nitratireducens]AEP29165.1 GTP-binding protein EngA [Glaciecola nitratireducens FR1064]